LVTDDCWPTEESLLEPEEDEESPEEDEELDEETCGFRCSG
jgi:hypothetical protein